MMIDTVMGSARLSPTDWSKVLGAANQGRRRSPSINRVVWPMSGAVIAREQVMAVSASFGCVLVTKIDSPEPQQSFNRTPA